MRTAWICTRDIYDHKKLDIVCISETPYEVDNWLVNQGLVVPVSFDDTIMSVDVIKAVEVDGVFSITKDNSKETTMNDRIKIEKLKFKKNKAEEIIIHINSIIDQWTIQEKVALLARQDVQVVLSFLNYGSIEQSAQLISTMTVDAVLTQEIKDSVLNFIDEKIAEFNAMTWS